MTRRDFLYSAARLFSLIPLLPFLGQRLIHGGRDFCQRTLLHQDFQSEIITVYKMVPLPGRKCDKAEVRHMANKIFPSIEAARARRPHRGFLYGLKPVPLPRSLVNGMDEQALFCGRKDFDQRVHADRHHWQNLGIDITAVFDVVRNT